VIGKPTLDPLHSGLRTGSYGERGRGMAGTPRGVESLSAGYLP